MNTNISSGTIGGTLLVLLFQVNLDQLLTTCLMAAVGAAVSYTVSVIMKYITGKLKRK